MRKTRHLFALVIAFGTVSPGFAEAEPVRIGLTFTLQSATADPRDMFGVPLATGDTFTGTLTYDTDAIDGHPDPVRGQYSLNGDLQLNLGSGFSTVGNTFTYDDADCGGGTLCDSFSFVAEPLIPGFDMGSFQVRFQGLPSSLNSDALPATAAEFLGAFNTTGIFFFAGQKIGDPQPWDAVSHELFGVVVASDAPVVTPEPGSIILLGTGLLGVVRAVRRKSRAA